MITGIIPLLVAPVDMIGNLTGIKQTAAARTVFLLLLLLLLHSHVQIPGRIMPKYVGTPWRKPGVWRVG